MNASWFDVAVEWCHVPALDLRLRLLIWRKRSKCDTIFIFTDFEQSNSILFHFFFQGTQFGTCSCSCACVFPRLLRTDFGIPHLVVVAMMLFSLTNAVFYYLIGLREAKQRKRRSRKIFWRSQRRLLPSPALAEWQHTTHNNICWSSIY